MVTLSFLAIAAVLLPTTLADLVPVIDEEFLLDSNITLNLYAILRRNATNVPGPEFYDEFRWYSAEPEQPDAALYAKKDGKCYIILRGTMDGSLPDWWQNLDPRFNQVCDDDGEVCCRVRNGYWQAWNANYVDDLVTDLTNCAATCEDPDNCVVIFGSSQGAGVAAVGALYLPHLKPIGITIGMPRAIQADCPLIDTSRWYRWWNTVTDPESTLRSGLFYDPMVNTPGLSMSHIGHPLIITDDTSAIYWPGLDSQQLFRPGLWTPLADVHDLEPYRARISAMMDRYRQDDALDFPVTLDGYSSGFACRMDDECQSKSCQSGACA